jgi:hypothetical protein
MAAMIQISLLTRDVVTTFPHILQLFFSSKYLGMIFYVSTTRQVQDEQMDAPYGFLLLKFSDFFPFNEIRGKFHFHDDFKNLLYFLMNYVNFQCHFVSELSRTQIKVQSRT